MCAFCCAHACNADFGRPGALGCLIGMCLVCDQPGPAGWARAGTAAFVAFCTFSRRQDTPAAVCNPLCPLSRLQSQIRKVRDRLTQVDKMGVPEDALDGHAFHTYTLTSADGSVEFVFKHNVTGRSIYAEGTVDAVLFLAKKMQEGGEQKVYSMIDVLRAGYLR